ncbi:metal-dependent transcriptional regulator [Isoptericola variabilis]|uniref:Iron (Metal) dependent repressor, DtxR family n=1 Tax=Isoptericola variabilis (strain 225) TaxID=743718 RepID=F6FTC1_ISOV2|nr:metal-dependent transcriptional regulator [Isoptericola variabilis]AEG45285.1 iron (metal) dependent repressor, DtxR family [Isoptericola variabilis 225]TWH34785.1 DtxR family iron (metal) dependent repressor [Isoptericola variabilis J7]
MTDLIDTTEMYLKTIYELDEEGITPLRARIAERLGHSGPTVSQTVARMERDGLVIVTGDRHLELTEAGQAKATRVMRKHRLAERLLTDVIKLDWEHVHTEACRWEHVMSDLVEKRLVTLLDHPHHDPYGNPIPGLSELGEQYEDVPFLEGVQSLPALFAGRAPAAPGGSDGQVAVRLQRIAEPLQVDVELLARLSDAGLVPGAQINARYDGAVYTVSVDGAETVLDLPEDLAKHLFVAAR